MGLDPILLNCIFISMLGSVRCVTKPCHSGAYGGDTGRAPLPQMLKAKANKGLNPSQAKRKRQKLGWLVEWLMGSVSALLICAVVALPWVLIVRTKAEPLPASALFFVVRAQLSLGGLNSLYCRMKHIRIAQRVIGAL